MINKINDISMQNVAKLAGIGYLIIFITGIFANFFALEQMLVSGDTAATAKNIMTGESLFRFGIFSFILMVLFDALLVWALYLLLEPVNRKLSLLSAWLRLINVAVFAVALIHLVNVLELVNSNVYGAELAENVISSQIYFSIGSFNNTWLIGLIFFGFHLFVLSYLIYKSGFIPKFIGVLLIIAGAGYLIDSFANILLPDYEKYKDFFQIIVIVPGVVGELSLTIWLLVRGAKMDYTSPV